MIKENSMEMKAVGFRDLVERREETEIKEEGQYRRGGENDEGERL